MLGNSHRPPYGMPPTAPRNHNNAHGGRVNRNKGRGPEAAMRAASQSAHGINGVRSGRTYADYSNATTAAASSSRGPVRITISKNAHYTIDPKTGLPQYEEIWEEEEIMDTATSVARSAELNPEIQVDFGCHRRGRESPTKMFNSPRSRPGALPSSNNGIEYAGTTETAPHGHELDANAEDAHQLVARASFIEVQKSSSGLHVGAGREGPSIMVLDTNTLLEHFVFLRQLFSLLLVRNLSAYMLLNVWPKAALNLLSGVSLEFRPAPFRLVLPHIVIRELDGLKTGGRSDGVRNAARQANRWILACLQAQKRSVSTFLSKDTIELIMRAAIAAGGASNEVAAAAEFVASSPIPPEAWALHFETARQYKERYAEDKEAARGRTNDELIVDLCVSLAASTSLPVWLLSNDTNARTHAEIEGIRALELENIVRQPAQPPPPPSTRKAITGAGTMVSTHAQSAAEVVPNGDGVRWSKKRTIAELSDPMVAARELIEQWDAQVGDQQLPLQQHRSIQGSHSPLAIEPSTPTIDGAFLAILDADGDEAMEM
ncbi:hypothetical protein A4X09_0g6418 [Tilletia walkeri]|uniref:PIN domain-containing protein n=1 Tax=Tilletia walkeri TaxID=117179 RepID=A0A8X7N4E2_9BASI|nr:hypothetical protein A4X09_0g6418 [Tilletia walkeri]